MELNRNISAIRGWRNIATHIHMHMQASMQFSNPLGQGILAKVIHLDCPAFACMAQLPQG